MNPHAAERGAWRLVVDNGQQSWQPTGEQDWQPTAVERHHLTAKSNDAATTVGSTSSCLEDGIERAIDFAVRTQTADGHWAGNFSGPLFLTPGWIVSCYVTNAVSSICSARCAEIVRYLQATANADGGWGLYEGGPSTMLGTALNYVALRILGHAASSLSMQRARAWILRHGGATHCPLWGKCWLALLNVYSWAGVTPMPPELWLLPYALPMHPGRLWCHTRQVYLSMSYLYGARVAAPETALVLELRQTLFCERYEVIDWAAARDQCCMTDRLLPMTHAATMMFGTLAWYDRYNVPTLRRTALDHVVDMVRAEDQASNCIGIGAVTKSLNTIVAWHRDGPNSSWFLQHLDRFRDFAWLGPTGMRMNGTDGSQTWDTALMVKALLSSRFGREAAVRGCMEAAVQFLKSSQIDVEWARTIPFRHPTKGGFPFSTKASGWVASDCTAAAIDAIASMARLSATSSLDGVAPAVEQLLSYASDDGGFGAYAIRKGPKWLEWLNPVQVFEDIMVEHTYVELTVQALQALHAAQASFPEIGSAFEFQSFMDKGLEFVRHCQRQDGSWYGSWAICFTYGTRYGLEGLALFGAYYHNDAASRRACDFLLAHQHSDGGWGESIQSSVQQRWTDSESHCTQTAWVVLGLLAAHCPARSAIDAAIHFLLRHQSTDGTWPAQRPVGVFNKTCAIAYSNYEHLFPLWALSRYYEH